MFKTSLLLVFLLALTGALWIHNRAPAPTLEIVGPSVLLNARDAGAVNIVDLRSKGRAVPDAHADYRPNNAPLFLLGEAATAQAWARGHQIQEALIIPPSMIEYQPLSGVPQLSPRAVRQKVEREGWPLFDISEDFEFHNSRLPRSQRFDYAQFRAGDWRQLPKDKPFIVACRVGHRSQLVVQQLRRKGYDARNLNGGLWQWECDGLEIVR